MATWTHIAHDSLSLPATTVTWSSIPQSYDHLCVKASARYSAAGSEAYRFDIVYNGDTTDADYSNTYLTSTSTNYTVQSGAVGGRNLAGYLTTSDFLADTFAATSVWIPNYSNSANYKQMLSQSVCPNNSATNNQWALRICSTMFHENTDAITEISMVAGGGNNFVANSTFDLYGILGA